MRSMETLVGGSTHRCCLWARFENDLFNPRILSFCNLVSGNARKSWGQLNLRSEGRGDSLVGSFAQRF